MPYDSELDLGMLATRGTVAGAVLRTVSGRTGVHEQRMNRILTCRPLAGIPGVARPRPVTFWSVDALWLAERLLFVGQAA
jgi:hypothetical protein